MISMLFIEQARRCARLFLIVPALLASGVVLADQPQTNNRNTQSISASALDASAPVTTRSALARDKPVSAPHAMVVTAQHLATKVGVNVLMQGGNAVDAAVAVGYALAVVHPCCGNIGGGGFMVLHLAHGENDQPQNLFLNFRETAPAAATPTLFQDEQGNVVDGRSTDSYLATGVPGTVMGLESARTRYGTMSRKQLMAPAIRLASEGFVLQQGDINILHSRSQDFASQPNVASIFLNHGKPYQVGDTLKQPQLAHTLSRIERKGTQSFYRGAIAKQLVQASQSNGGILTRQDLADYKTTWSEPVSCQYRGYTIESAPPPSSGGTAICEILGMLEPLPMASWGYGSAKASHYLIEAERRAFADRNTYLGDPAFVDNPVARLLSADHLAQLRGSIDPDRATPSSAVHGSLGADEGQHTTQYSIVDPQGNAASVTYTINYLFGTGRMAGDTGFFLNNEMDDFTAKPGVPNAFGLVQGKANQVEGGKRPLSSMSPSLVLKDNDLFMVTGSPGGSTIISTTLESMLHVIDYGMNIQQSVNAPRIHNQWQPDMTKVEPGYLSESVRQTLEEMGHSFHQVQSWGADEAILRAPDSGELHGANDRRRPAGMAAGF